MGDIIRLADRRPRPAVRPRPAPAPARRSRLRPSPRPTRLPAPLIGLARQPYAGADVDVADLWATVRSLGAQLAAAQAAASRPPTGGVIARAPSGPWAGPAAPGDGRPPRPRRRRGPAGCWLPALAAVALISASLVALALAVIVP